MSEATAADPCLGPCTAVFSGYLIPPFTALYTFSVSGGDQRALSVGGTIIHSCWIDERLSTLCPTTSYVAANLTKSFPTPITLTARLLHGGVTNLSLAWEANPIGLETVSDFAVAMDGSPFPSGACSILVAPGVLRGSRGMSRPQAPYH